MYFKKNTLRLSLVFFFLIFCFGFFFVRLVLLQVFHSDHLARLAARQHNYVVDIEPVRGGIFDRRLRPLAFNVSVYSIYANPRAMTKEEQGRAADQLAEILHEDISTLRTKLNRDKFFVWLERKIPADVAQKIHALKMPGIGLTKESKRFYPNGSLAAHIIGFAGIDNHGLEGLELNYDHFLEGKPGKAKILRDAHQRELLIEHDYVAPKDGADLVLTVDETIQYIAERALERGVAKAKAKGGSVIVMDVKTGEILALTNRPTYDLDDAFNSPVDSRTNRALTYVYEPGSIFKIVTASAALQEGIYKETDKIFCENGKYFVVNHVLSDHTAHGMLTMSEVIQYSSNIGVVKMAQKMGPALIYDYGKRFHFGSRTGIDLKGEVSGWLKNPSQWSKTTIGAIPIGYEITATPMQLVSAMAAVANDGVFMKPFVVKMIKDERGHVIKSFTPQKAGEAITPDTAHRLRDILIQVVENGTAGQAKIEGVKVAGKTGTARKVVNGAYAQGAYYASFVGFAPADNPRIAVMVVVDDPRGTYFGGTVSAPIFKEVVSNTLRYMEASGDDEIDQFAQRR